MSKMQELYEKVSKDSMLQEKFANIIKNAEAVGEKATEEKLTVFAKEAGYDVTVEEMQTFFKELAETNKTELSDGELDMVAGGKTLGWVVYSIATIGIGCAVASITGLTQNKSCEQFVNEQFDMQV